MKNLKDILESLLDIDDNIDNLDPEVMYGLWNAKTGDEYEKMGERIEKLVNDECKVASYLPQHYTPTDLKPNKYYFGFNWVLDTGPMFGFDVYYKKNGKYFELNVSWWDFKNKMDIRLSEIHPDHTIWLNPKETFEADKTLTWVIEKLIKLVK